MSNTKEKAPVNWNFTRQLTRIFENFKERYFRNMQSTSWLFENSEFDSYDKIDMKDKVNDLVRLHKAVREKLKKASFSKQNPNSYFCTWWIVLNILFKIF